MSYEPTVWKDGDLVTSAKLNKIEQGVAAAGGTTTGGVMVVETTFIEDPNDYYNKYFETSNTTTEIKTAFLNGISVILHIPFATRAQAFSFEREEYHRMDGYTIDGSESETFIFSSLTDGGGLYKPTIQNNKLQFQIYVD